MSFIPIPVDINGSVAVGVAPQQLDVVGNIVTAQRNTLIVATFADSPITDIQDLINIVKTGTGDATLSQGSAIFSSGAGTTSSVIGTTFTNVTYNPGFEVHSSYSASFTTPTSTNSSQLLGIWDITNNGFYIGYSGTAFGIGVVNGGVDTFTDRGSWNGDLLDGNALSKFTRGGVPEAINFTYLNLYRIRYSWWGSSPIIYEVLSPDNNWIVFHTLSVPNSSVAPPVRTPNLPISLRISKSSADATNLIMRCGSWTAGTTAPFAVDVVNYITTDWVAATAQNTVLETPTLGSGSVSISLIINGAISAGAVTFEFTPNGDHWFPMKLTNVSGQPDGLFSTYPLINGNFTTESYTGGYLKMRARLSTAIIGSGQLEISLRPSISSVSRYTNVYQSDGSNLHTVVDSGTITTTNSSSTGNAPASVSVGVASATAVSTNTLRKGLILTNTSNRTISLGLNGAPAVLNSGITLLPGGIWVMDSFTFTTGAISAIAGAAAANLAIQEMQ